MAAVDNNPTTSGKDPASYEVMPLLFQNPDGEISENKLINNLVYDQGYEAHCGNQQWVIKKEIWGSLSSYFDSASEENYWNTGEIVFDQTTPYMADLSKAHVPLIRGMEPSLETMKNSSFEGFFGANMQLPEEMFTVDGVRYLQNAAGVAEKRLSTFRQCVYKKQNIDAIGRICSAIVGPCVLNKEITIPANSQTGVQQTTMKVLDIQSLFKKIRPGLQGDELNYQVCNDLTGGDENKRADSADPSPADDYTLFLTHAAINMLPIDIDNLYRLAFLVLVPQQDPDDGEDKFYYLQESANVNERKHAPIFIAFKIPEFATNKSYTVRNIDSLELVKMGLQNSDTNRQDLIDQEEKRSDLAGKTKTVSGQSMHDKAINCEGLPQCERTEENVLKNTLIDIVNASNLDCQIDTLVIMDYGEDGDTAGNQSSTVENIFNQKDINYEKAGDLYVPANKDIKEYSYVYNNNNELINDLESNTQENFHWNLVINDEKDTQLGDNIIVNAYLVLPVGETVKDANKSLAIFWSKDTFIEMVKENTLADMMNKQGAIPKFYTFKGENVKFNASDSFPFCYKSEMVMTEDENGFPIYSYECSDEKKVGFSLIDGKESLLLPDFGLGWMIRKIQQQIRSVSHDSYEYVASCQRIEDLFLGRCGGAASGNAPQTVTSANCPAVLTYSDSIKLNKEGFLNELTERYPNTIMTESLFDYVVSEAKKVGWNPALFLALGREETAWGAVGNIKVMGCLGGPDLTSSSTPQEIVDHQISCITRNFSLSMSCEDFMCKYSGDAAKGPCEIKLNPIFAVNLPIFYRALTETNTVEEYLGAI